MGTLSSFVQMIDTSCAGAATSFQQCDIDHPYWQIVSRLSFLEGVKSDDVLKKTFLELALDVAVNPSDKLFLQALFKVPRLSLSVIESKLAKVLREKYSYSALSPLMLDTICSYAPFVEIGSGNGYNTWLLRQKGVEVHAFDINPVQDGGNWFYTNNFGLPAKERFHWTDVQRGNTLKARNYPEHTLFLCWPAKNSMAIEAVNNYLGRTVIFIGDRAACADRDFYEEMESNWTMQYKSVRSVRQISKFESFLIYTR